MNGSKNIEDIQIGDYVLAENPETGEIDYKEVVQTFVRYKDTIIHVIVNGTEIETTSEHPFWVEEKGFVEAGSLQQGDILRLSSGAEARVEALWEEAYEDEVVVYNFEVVDFHTYFVSELGVLVHNTCSAGNSINTTKILDSASAAKKGGETVAGHALQKHAGRNPNIWGKVSGNSANINKIAMQHIDDIINGTGKFKTVQTNGISFLEKMLPDGRGIRLNMDGTFKGFIDQSR